MKIIKTSSALICLISSLLVLLEAAEKAEVISNKSDAHLEALLLGNKGYYPTTWMEKGRVLYLEGKYSEAIQAFFQATRINASEPSIWFNLGMAYYQNAQYDEALISFLEAHRIQKSEKYIFHACLSYFKIGKIHQTIRYSRQLLSDHPKNGQAWKLLAQSYEHLSQFGEAKSAYLKAQALLPEDGEVIYALDHLKDQTVVPLHMPIGFASAVPEAVKSHADFTGKLPLSRIFDSTAPEFSAPSHQGLIPLAENYHLNFDAPKSHAFHPSEEVSWDPKQETQTSDLPAAKPVLEDL